MKKITPTNKLTLPFPKSGYAIAPNLILRSPLFPAIDMRAEPVFLLKKEIYEDKKITILFSGYQLNQSDFDVWLALIQHANDIAQTANQYNCVPIFEGEILAMIGRDYCGSNVKWLRRSIEKLAVSLIEINHKASSDFFGGHPINEYSYHHELKLWHYSLSKEFVLLFTPGNWSKINWAIRQRINKQPTAMWLHSFYSSHKPSNIPISIDHIHHLCGSTEQNMSNFKRRLIISCNLLSEACQAEGKTFEATFIKKLILVKHSF